jgi:hypothetical protein
MLRSYAYIYMFWNLVCKRNDNNFGEIWHGHFNSKFKTSITLIFGEMYVEKTWKKLQHNFFKSIVLQNNKIEKKK